MGDEDRKKTLLLVATLFLCNAQGQHIHFTWTTKTKLCCLKTERKPKLSIANPKMKMKMNAKPMVA